MKSLVKFKSSSVEASTPQDFSQDLPGHPQDPFHTLPTLHRVPPKIPQEPKRPSVIPPKKPYRTLSRLHRPLTPKQPLRNTTTRPKERVNQSSLESITPN